MNSDPISLKRPPSLQLTCDGVDIGIIVRQRVNVDAGRCAGHGWGFRQSAQSKAISPNSVGIPLLTSWFSRISFGLELIHSWCFFASSFCSVTNHLHSSCRSGSAARLASSTKARARDPSRLSTASKSTSQSRPASMTTRKRWSCSQTFLVGLVESERSHFQS